MIQLFTSLLVSYVAYLATTSTKRGDWCSSREFMISLQISILFSLSLLVNLRGTRSMHTLRYSGSCIIISATLNSSPKPLIISRTVIIRSPKTISSMHDIAPFVASNNWSSQYTLGCTISCIISSMTLSSYPKPLKIFQTVIPLSSRIISIHKIVLSIAFSYRPSWSWCIMHNHFHDIDFTSPSINDFQNAYTSICINTRYYFIHSIRYSGLVIMVYQKYRFQWP